MGMGTRESYRTKERLVVPMNESGFDLEPDDWTLAW